MKKRAQRFALHGLAAACLAWAAPATAAVPPGAAAEILNLQGTGEQRPGGAPDWKPARVAQPLAAGDYVRTRESSRMALLFADQTQVRLNQNTVLQVKGVATPAQPTTTLLLEAGRAWAQTRRAPGSRLNLQTPAATAGIRGTDWDIEVGPDGKTLLTVLSGQVEFSNEQGSVLVASNEAAVAEVGKAPVKIQLTQPRDRIQWVNALRAEPERFRGLEPALAGILARADRQITDGETTQAIATLEAGRARFPASDELRAQMARAQLLGDRVEDSARTLGESRANDSASMFIARGALARRQGDARGTLAAYGRATQLAPDDDRGWFGLGSAHVEREDANPARAALLRAIEINPQGAGYRGELGTLETFGNDLQAADAAFAGALADNPGDYVALTGLGLLRLKQGRPEDALDAFLRAGVMEPRFARAKTFTAVAYWQLGRRDDAIATLKQAIALDDRDPVPHLLLSQIYTDLFRAGDAVQASRDAVARMPYLKSLNQLANDQQGRANAGAALAFFGMEEWAMELAQQGQYPYWGGSHLFLADRYPGEFNKNSELFQGFLTDPLAFGASPRFSSLVQQPGLHGTLGMTLTHETFRMASPSVTLNGLSTSAVPVAVFARGQRANATRYPLYLGAAGAAATDNADVGARVGTLGLGSRPTTDLGVFFYYNDIDLEIDGKNRFDLFGNGETAASRLDNKQRQAAAGLSYRWSPVSQTWLKAGHNTEFSRHTGFPSPFASDVTTGTLALDSQPQKRVSDVQLRHTLDLPGGTRLWAGVEHVKERQHNDSAAFGPVTSRFETFEFPDIMVFGTANRIDRRYTAFTLAARHPLVPGLEVDGSVAATQIRQRVQTENRIVFINLQTDNTTTSWTADTRRAVTPRLGVVWQPRADMTVRAAYQDWLRPLNANTLGSVETAGIPVEDRLVEAGGRHKRAVAQLGLTLGERTFVSARLDHLKVENPTSEGVDQRTPSIPFLEDLRNAQLVNLSATDVLEDTPSFQRGTVRSAVFAANHMLDRRWSAYAKYQHQDTDSSYGSGATRVDGKRIPFLPRHTVVLGTTWASEQRFYASGRVVYRSTRFEDQENLSARPAGWSLDLMGFWETADKRWVIGAAALNLTGKRSASQSRSFILDARYRF